MCLKNTKSPCDKNTCKDVTSSSTEMCAQYIEIVDWWCTCEEEYYRDSKNICVTLKECWREKYCTWNYYFFSNLIMIYELLLLDFSINKWNWIFNAQINLLKFDFITYIYRPKVWSDEQKKYNECKGVIWFHIPSKFNYWILKVKLLWIDANANKFYSSSFR